MSVDSVAACIEDSGRDLALRWSHLATNGPAWNVTSTDLWGAVYHYWYVPTIGFESNGTAITQDRVAL